MILPEIKRIVRFEAMNGRTIEEIRVGTTSVRLIFTDGHFADIEAESGPVSPTIVLYRKPSRLEKRRWREYRG